MIQLRRSKERGHFDHGWLNTYHSFSFADYYDPAFMGFRTLRVINEDVIGPAQGFGTHPHRDMEIVTYVLSGALEHKDSMGNGSVISEHEVQYMSAGSGILHSEFNSSKKSSCHLLQIWILPNQKNAIPRYDQKNFTRDQKLNRLHLFVSESGEDGSISIRQDVKIFGSILEKNIKVNYPLNPARHAWVQVAKGAIELNGERLSQGDGAAISEEKQITFQGLEPESEFVLFDLN